MALKSTKSWAKATIAPCHSTGRCRQPTSGTHIWDFTRDSLLAELRHAPLATKSAAVAMLAGYQVCEQLFVVFTLKRPNQSLNQYIAIEIEALVCVCAYVSESRASMKRLEPCWNKFKLFRNVRKESRGFDVPSVCPKNLVSILPMSRPQHGYLLSKLQVAACKQRTTRAEGNSSLSYQRSLLGSVRPICFLSL